MQCRRLSRLVARKTSLVVTSFPNFPELDQSFATAAFYFNSVFPRESVSGIKLNCL